ncbi:pimeloyl-ACP methyl ester carboxylesterase [Streptomyces tendae]|uniref:alpha/beta hydrolase n=1 Tax=Streptomyces tendae TaxID=1932 RepID=UPI0038392669
MIELTDHDVDGIHVQRADPERRTHEAPLLLVHGGCHGAWCWEHYVPYFADRGWQVHALSWRGHGRSAALPEQEAVRRPIEDVAQDIQAVAAHLDSPPVVIAHSMGTLAALKYAERNRHSGLVLLTPVAPVEASPAPVDVPFDPEAMWGPPPYELACRLFFHGAEEADARRYYELLVPESSRAVQQAVTTDRVSIDPVRISGPALIVSSEHDQLAPAGDVHRMADLLRADYHYAHGFGHGVMMDRNWEQLAHVLQTWLASRAPMATGSHLSTAS